MNHRDMIKVLLAVFLVYSSQALSVTSEWGEKNMTAADIPAVLSSLRATGSDGSFVVFLVPGTAMLDGYDANIQFSIESSVLGFDWVLRAQRNKTDRSQVSALATEFGLTCKEGSKNNVSYLRCTGKSDYSGLAKELISNFYKLSAGQGFSVIYESFSWPNPNK